MFTTAFAEHAVRALRARRAPRHLKPFGPTRLAPAMERVRSAIGVAAAHPSLARLEARLEARLDTESFLRMHRTHIVNLDDVRTFKRGLRGQLVAEMTDGTRLSVSRARAQELRSLGV